MELYGVSPSNITIIMVLVTLFFPVGGFNLIEYGTYEASGANPFVYSTLYVIFINEGLSSLWRVFDPFLWLSTIWLTIPLTLLNLLYVRQIWRHFMGYSTKSGALFVGLLSLVVPPCISIYISYMGFPFGLIVPIPLQFICGLVLLNKFREPELISPWTGMDIDWSWWRSGYRKDNYTNLKLPSFSQRLQDHEADWLEEEW